MNASAQSREIASRCHIRHALAVERARAMVAMIGHLADQVSDRIGKMVENGTGDPAKAIETFARELPKTMNAAFREHARWSWARSNEIWTVLQPWQRARVSARLVREAREGFTREQAWDTGGSSVAVLTLREDDLAPRDLGKLTTKGDNVRIFSAPSAAKVDRWVSNPGWFQDEHRSWEDRLEALSHRIADKGELRDTITKLYSDGASPDQIRRAIQPNIDGIRTSAQRIARTETLRISEEAQRETYRQVDDLIAGIQIWATLDDRTRPEHAARNGTIYPKDAAPLVPDEPNCRCFSAPVMRDEADIIKADVGGRPAGDLTVVNGTVQDLETWSNWFDDQSPARQRAILGPERWNALEPKVEKVRWAHVVDDSGYMSSPEQLAAADPQALRARTAATPLPRLGETPAAAPEADTPARKTTAGLFTKADIEAKILSNAESLGLSLHDAEALGDAGTGLGVTKFYKKLPGEVTDFLQGRPEARRLFSVTNVAREAGGNDALAQLGDKYFDIIERMSGKKIEAAKDLLRGHPDPQNQFLVAIHDNLPGGRLPPKQAFAPEEIRTGAKFTINGEKFHVEASPDGSHRILSDGGNIPEVPLEALDVVPVDKGTLNAKSWQVVDRTAPGRMPSAIADETPIVNAEVPPNSPLGRLLDRTGAGDEPIGVPLQALNSGKAANLTAGETAPAAGKVATPNLRGIRGANLPEWVSKAFVPVEDSNAGRRVAAAIQRMSPKVLSSPTGAERMARIVEAPGSRASEATRAYWRKRATGHATLAPAPF